MKGKLLTAMACVLMSSSAVASEEGKKGFEAFQKGDYQTALQVLRPLAEQGNDRHDELMLGYVYENGTHDYAEAFKWYRRAAEHAHPLAYVTLGTMYVQGKGVTQNYQEAKFWFEKAAAMGVRSGQTSMGTMYLNGEGVPEDHAKALMYFQLAAAQDDDNAQAKLGIMYELGKGVPQDYVEAHKWYNLAGSNGNKEAIVLRDALARQMTTAQIAEAQELARKWKPKTK